MSSVIQHPSSLNPWQQYRQARSIYRHTSRASNPAWYQSALELDLQLHIRPDGQQVFTSYFNRKTSQWSPGPPLTGEALRNEEQFESFAAKIIEHARGNGASSIGVVLHVADEFATTELKPELDNPAALPDLRALAVNDPGEILEDTTFNNDENSCRVVPYLAAGCEVIATTITLSRQYAPILSTLRRAGEDQNFPVITQALSAPLVAVMGLSSILPSQPDKPFVTILQYPWFTVLAFFNQHADLVLIRSLQHRGMRQASNMRNALFTTSTSLEFLDPDLYILPLGSEVDGELESNLKHNFQNCRIETLKLPASNDLPHWFAEPVIINEEPDKATVSSLTFSSFRDDRWALQDFLSDPREIAELQPAKAEMLLMRMTGLIRIVVVLLALAGLGYFGLGIISLLRMPEWSFNPNDTNLAKVRLNMLNGEKLRISYWDNMLADRSKAWCVMESFARMFPEGGNMLVKDIKFSAKPDNAGGGQATVGFVKVWKISGLARDEAIAYLNTLNTRDGINKYFNHIAEVTGCDAYRTDIGNRNISVNVRTRENNAFRLMPAEDMVMTDPTTYPFSFDLTITQRFEATDPMAINVQAAP